MGLLWFLWIHLEACSHLASGGLGRAFSKDRATLDVRGVGPPAHRISESAPMPSVTVVVPDGGLSVVQPSACVETSLPACGPMTVDRRSWRRSMHAAAGGCVVAQPGNSPSEWAEPTLRALWCCARVRSANRVVRQTLAFTERSLGECSPAGISSGAALPASASARGAGGRASPHRRFAAPAALRLSPRVAALEPRRVPLRAIATAARRAASARPS